MVSCWDSRKGLVIQTKYIGGFFMSGGWDAFEGGSISAGRVQMKEHFLQSDSRCLRVSPTTT